MAKPLQSEERGLPMNIRFAQFGVLDTGTQSKTSTIISLTINLLLAFVLFVIGAAATKTIDKNRMLTELTEPVIKKKVEPVKPRIVPPKPKLPDVVMVEQPRIILPKIKLPELPKQPIVKMDLPKPILAPPAPKQVVAMAAPKVVSLAHPQAASVVNNDAHPSPVRLGNTTSPLNNLKGPSVSKVNLGAGMPGMNSANSGNGPAATKINLGNGSPGGTSIRGNGVIAVAGIPHGVPGAAPNGTGRVAGQVNLGQATAPSMPKAATLSTVVQRTTPKVLYKPRPEYTAEARQLRIEGVVTLRIRVQTSGSVEVLSVVNGLGHGLDESAKRAIEATKFQPATDVSGQPIPWDGVVNVTFQLAG
jgi:TonB family protein